MVSRRSPLPPHLRRRFRPAEVARVEGLLRARGLHTVCQSAHCPNVGECFGRGTATFLILGEVCTRHCRFCAIASDAPPAPPDPGEPARVLEAVRALGLSYVVITSVTRDDLPLGGAEQFAACIRVLREGAPGVRIEVLTPDFAGCDSALDLVLDAGPDVFNHNVETVPALYPAVRPEAGYARSLRLLERAARHAAPRAVTKSGLMLGLGETPEQVLAVFDDLRRAGCEMLTIGQYLAPSSRHHPVVEFVALERFEWYREEALRRGFRHVAAAPFVRSSYHAEDAHARHQRTRSGKRFDPPKGSNP
jgi:lipoic acid synthetase